MIDTLRLTAEGAISLVERGEVSAAELHAAYLEAIAQRDCELHCYLRTREEPNGDSIPIALKDVISTKGIETTAGSRILEGYTPVEMIGYSEFPTIGRSPYFLTLGPYDFYWFELQRPA